MTFLWNEGYLYISDDATSKKNLIYWYENWERFINETDNFDKKNIELMKPKTFSLRLKMNGKILLAFSICSETDYTKHKLQIEHNILSNLSKFNLKYIYNIKTYHIENLDELISKSEYKKVCPTLEENYFEDLTPDFQVNVSFSTFNQLNSENKFLKESLRHANEELSNKENELVFLRNEIIRMRDGDTNNFLEFNNYHDIYMI